MKTKIEKLIDIAQKGPVRVRDLGKYDIPTSYLYKLCKRGILEKVEWGLYQLADAPITENHGLAVVSRLVPKGTICLLSALQFHSLTTESPHGVWVMIHRHARKPSITNPNIQVVRACNNALSYGVETHLIENTEVKVTSPEKTVADCFRYRDHVGMKVALAALRDYLKTYRGNVDKLITAAKADRINSFMQPYIEAMI